MDYEVTTLQITPQWALFVQLRIDPSAIGAAAASALPRVFVHARDTGAAISGRPFMRYVECWPGLTTIHVGIPIAAPVDGSGSVLADRLPGGLVATTTHIGVRYRITEAYAATRLWIAARHLVIRGGPWESWLTDPSRDPDSAQWQTEVFWPVEHERQTGPAAHLKNNL